MEGFETTERATTESESGERAYPASQAQAGLWFETRLDPDSRHYHLVWETTIRGPLEPRACEEAWQVLAKRHPSLRTRFAEPADATDADVGVVALVSETVCVPFEFTDLRGGSDGAVSVRCAEAAQDLGRRPMNLRIGPLFGVRLLRVGELEHRMLVVIHHMVADGFSWSILLKEWLRLISGGELSEPALTPGAISRWQAEFLHSDRGRDAEEYWRGQFPDAPAMSEIPGAEPRPPDFDRSGAAKFVDLDPDVVRRVKAVSKERGTSFFRALLAAFAAVQSRWIGESDVVVGTTLLGRTLEGAESVVGFLNNVAAVRTSIGEPTTFAEVLHGMHAAVGQAVQHQEYPFSRLARHWKSARSPGRFGLTSVSFTKLPASLRLREGRYEVTERRVFLDRSPHELAFYVQEAGSDTVRLICEFNPRIYGDTTIERYLGQYLQFVDAASREPAARVLKHSLVRDVDRAVLPDPGVSLEKPAYATVLDRLEARWNGSPHLPAIRHFGREWTYAEIGNTSARLAERLVSGGIGAGDVVAVTGPRSFGLIVAMIGIWRAGGVLLSLDPNLPDERRRLMLEQGRAVGSIVVGSEAIRSETATDVGGKPSRLHRWEVTLEGEWTPMGESAASPTIGWDSAHAAAVPDDRRGRGDEAYLFFTSGTTGAPKAVLGSHAGLGHFLDWQGGTFGIGPDDRAAQLTGLSFDVVLRDVFTPLTRGAVLCLPAPEDEHGSETPLRWLASERITLLHVVPSLAMAWLEQAGSEETLKDLRLTFFAGEPLTDALVRRWKKTCPGSRIINLYGPTETTLAKCWHEVGDEPDPGVQPVGLPQPQTQALVLNAAGTLCGVGEPGEIVIRTPFRSLGYANSAEETERKFVPNPFGNEPDDRIYLTGDRGRYRADGRLEILGRMDFQVKIRGVRIELNEVTAAMASHPGVASSVVIAREDVPGRKYLAGYVVARDTNDGLSSKLTEHLRRVLPAAYVPEVITVLERLPLTANGKVDRKALPVPVRERRSESCREPKNLIERQVMDMMRELLRDGTFGPDDNFFEAGGHSMLALRLMAGLRRLLGVDVPVRSLFAQPTPAGLAIAIEVLRRRGAANPWHSLTALNIGAAGRPALFVFTGGNGGDRELYVHSYVAQKWLGSNRPVYGLRMKGWDGLAAPHSDIRTMARDYIAEMKSVQPSGPFLLLGDCTGGNIAFETACQLQAAGDAVPLLILTDCIRPRAFEYERFVFREMWRRWRRGGHSGSRARQPREEVSSAGGQADRADAASAAPSADAPDMNEYWTPLGRQYRRVITRYRPGRFQGKVRLVVSQGRATDPNVLRWGNHATDGCAVTELPDNHWLYLWHHGHVLRPWVDEAGA